MNKQTFVAPNPSDLVLKEAFHGKKKSGQSREFQPETCSDDADRSQQLHSKISSHFDYSNLGLFFGGRPGQVKSPHEGIIGKLHNKKKSNDTTSSKEGTLKHASSKDYSNLDELFENTTIISNPSETKPHTKRRSNEISLTKGANDDANDLAQANFLETLLFKNHNKKKSSKNSFSSLLKAQREDRLDEEIAQDINKLGLDIGADEQDKGDIGNFKDLKVPKSNLKVLELIKNKALPTRPITTSPPKADPRTGKLTKAVSPIILSYQDQDIYNDDNAAQDKFINELFENPKTETSEDIPLDKSKEISQEDLNPRLLTERTTNKHMRKVANLNLDSSRDNRTKPNLSLLSTESTVDSENLANQQDHHNNSFSTPFSGASGSFNNSGKLDFSSPARLDSGRIHSENSEMNYMQGGYPMQKNMNMMNSRMPTMPPAIPRVQMNLNQSCMNFCGGYGSGSNSDRSTNLSFNEEYINNAFPSSFNTPQNHPQNFLNNNFNMTPNPNIMDQFFIAPQNLNNNFNMVNQQSSMSTPSNQERSSLSSGKTNNPSVNDGKNPSRMRRKTQEAEDGKLYEINIDSIEETGRTTVMIRNIPNKYDLPLITQTIEKNHKGKYDFFYLPIDFSNRCNFGYAFINFSNPKFIKDFYLEFNGKKWEKFNSEKICEIKFARIQGYHALMQHFQYSRVMNQQDKKLRPYIPPKYGLPNKHKIEELVRQQKLESAKEGKEMDYNYNYNYRKANK